jgi:hypothetical protein
VFVQPRDPGQLQLRVPEKVVEVAQNETGAEVFFDVVAYGSADPDPVVECSPPSGWFFPMKETKVFCTAQDDFGGRAEAGFYVEVVERLGLKLPDVTAEATSPSGTEVTWEAPWEAIAENWTNPITCSPSSGSLFALGATSVECESTDARGRRAGGKFLVNVADTIAPHSGRVRANAAPHRRHAPVQIDVDVTDAADAMPRCSIATLTADDGGAFDWRIRSDPEVDVRGGANRAFRILVTCATPPATVRREPWRCQRLRAAQSRELPLPPRRRRERVRVRGALARDVLARASASTPRNSPAHDPPPVPEAHSC